MLGNFQRLWRRPGVPIWAFSEGFRFWLGRPGLSCLGHSRANRFWQKDQTNARPIREENLGRGIGSQFPHLHKPRGRLVFQEVVGAS